MGLFYSQSIGKDCTLEVTNLVAIVTIGLTVGIISVYLGIGGGPLNIALLVYFFSMKAKDAAAYSIFNDFLCTDY